MDSIEKINNFNLQSKINPSPVVLKRKSSNTTTISYILIASNLSEVVNIIDTKELTANLYETLKDNKLITLNEDVKQVLFCGNLEKFKHYERFVFKFPERKVDIRNRKEPQYRLYTRTLEEQKNVMWLLNLCSSPKNSWLSALTKIGTYYGLLLKVETKK